MAGGGYIWVGRRSTFNVGWQSIQEDKVIEEKHVPSASVIKQLLILVM